MAQFELYKDRADEYRWRFRADNGKIIADSGEGCYDAPVNSIQPEIDHRKGGIGWSSSIV